MADPLGLSIPSDDPQTIDYLGAPQPIAFKNQPALPVAGAPIGGGVAPSGPGGVGAGPSLGGPGGASGGGSASAASSSNPLALAQQALKALGLAGKLLPSGSNDASQQQDVNSGADAGLVAGGAGGLNSVLAKDIIPGSLASDMPGEIQPIEPFFNPQSTGDEFATSLSDTGAGAGATAAGAGGAAAALLGLVAQLTGDPNIARAAQAGGAVASAAGVPGTVGAATAGTGAFAPAAGAEAGSLGAAGGVSGAAAGAGAVAALRRAYGRGPRSALLLKG